MGNGNADRMNEDDQRDEWLMDQVAKGRRRHLAKLVHRHGSALLTFLVRMIGDRHRGEELFQDVFLAVWTKRRLYKYPRPFRPWLFAIAANRARTAARRFRPERRTAESIDRTGDAPAADGPTPADAFESAETATLVTDALARLPARQRTIVVMRIYNGMSYAEIAESIGRSEGTARSRMHHALAALRKFLEPRMNDG